MDGDTRGTPNADHLSGDTKQDAAELAQSAIIKQDVMLSGTSTQSPVSSVLTMPTVSMPTGSMATAAMATSLTGALGDGLFLGAVSADADKVDAGGLTSMQASQLLGQPSVGPQFILAGGALQSPNTTAAAAASSLGLQHLLIPVSTGNGAQHLLSIPLSLAANTGNQLQLLTTSNGQLLATQLSNLAQPMNMSIPSQAGAVSTQATASQAAAILASQQAALQQTSTNHATQVAQQQAAAAGLPQLITNAQGQIVAIGAPQVMQQTVAVSQSSQTQAAAALALAAGVQNGSSSPSHLQTSAAQAQMLATRIQNLTAAGVTQQALQNAIHNSQLQAPTVNHNAISLSSGTTTSVALVTQPSAMVTQHAAINSSSSSLAPNINQLLPNTISSADATVVDGVNLDEIREFAKQFKIRRLSLGLTQTQVGQALSAAEGPSYSQSAICRFEKLDITPKSAQKIKPVLERWMSEAEERYKNGMENLTDFIGSEPSKKRKRRTSFTPCALEVLNEHFERNTHPSGAEMTELSDKLNYEREVIRVWFCNKRQALKNTIKKLKASDVMPHKDVSEQQQQQQQQHMALTKNSIVVCSSDLTS
ncbi:hypothetical protein CAPTEDRAFT_223281 [Capitella teleta]|uniref:POU domain protein n=1 Tax=Capitella teleta TaxID=283909 RepID=R7VCA4_CAPTE|nr:hypothetical protein CAPTEDRAFT_223281 [Capitella teleta]|eukprot:ELU13951.1 hypothetical protein CAPTEDRAFT_223281 [Capitella teleta]